MSPLAQYLGRPLLEGQVIRLADPHPDMVPFTSRTHVRPHVPLRDPKRFMFNAEPPGLSMGATMVNPCSRVSLPLREGDIQFPLLGNAP